MLLREECFLEIVKSGSLFGNNECDIEVPKKLRKAIANFPPIFRNNNVGRDDIGPFIKDYAKKGEWCRLRRMLISSYWKEEQSLHRCCFFVWICGWFARKLIVLCITIQWYVSTTLLSLLVSTKGERYGNPNSSIMTDTMKILVNSSFGYQNMDWSRHSVT